MISQPPKLPDDMSPIVYTSTAARVVFGCGTSLQLRDEISRLGGTIPLLLCTHSRLPKMESLRDELNMAHAVIFSEAVMHTPHDVTAKAVSMATAAKVDILVSCGGGSAIGLGKAISVRLQLPHIAMPTTYAGSEMTAILGETENGIKKTRRGPHIQPTTVIYDVLSTLSLSPVTSAYSGMNAIAHAVEALWAKNGNPLTTLMALEGIKALANSLPEIVKCPSSQTARIEAMYGAWLCGVCLGTVDMSLHHKLCHTLGGTFGLPHAETHAIMLPYVIAYNYTGCCDEMAILADVLPDSGGDALHGILLLQQRLGISMSLKDCGLDQNAIGKVAQIAMRDPYHHVKPVGEAELVGIITAAWAGESPKRAP